MGDILDGSVEFWRYFVGIGRERKNITWYCGEWVFVWIFVLSGNIWIWKSCGGDRMEM